MRPRKDWTNKKFNLLTFVRPLDKQTKNGVVWELLCECGNVTEANAWDVTHGHKTSCGCFKIKSATDRIKKIKHRKYPPIISSARKVWNHSTYKDDCPFEIFYEKSQQNCFYCGRKPYTTYNVVRVTRGYSSAYELNYQLVNGNFTYNGLDRVDNAQGHTPDNIVPCCFHCNRAKSTLTKEDFLKMIEMIYNNLIKK